MCRFAQRSMNPLARCTEHHEMVCKDSAVEVFLAFAEKGKELTNNDMYLNFEVNANGAMYAKYGFGRQGRQFLSDEVYKETGVNSVIEKDHWTMSLLIPEKFLKEVCDYLPDGSGKEIYCNFYKISEDPAVEHYISFHQLTVRSQTSTFRSFLQKRKWNKPEIRKEEGYGFISQKIIRT